VDNIKIDPLEIGWSSADWIGVAQDKETWGACFRLSAALTASLRFGFPFSIAGLTLRRTRKGKVKNISLLRNDLKCIQEASRKKHICVDLQKCIP
jgi:hypothetical protein